MSQEGLQAAVVFLFALGAGVGLYLARLLFS